MADTFLPTLSQNLLENLDDEDYYDITIEVGNDPLNMKTFHAHMIILNCRSPYLRRVLSTNKKKNDGTLEHIKLPNISPKIFQIILRYIYGGRLSLEKCDTSDIFKILIAASNLNLQELITYIQSFLIKNESNWMEQNFNLIYQTSFENDSFLELQKYCNDLISREPDKIFNSLNFSSITENLLVSLIKNEKHQMNEIQIWEHVLKWGLAQNPELPSDPASLSKEDFNLLKNTLQQCIPFIRFNNLTAKEFLENVFPYREILPEELFVNLLKIFLNHDYKPPKKLETEAKSEDQTIKEIKEVKLMSIDSKIITYQHAELISKWIDRLEFTYKIKNSYNFKLLFRGSRDGLTHQRFHEVCDNQSRTVSIVKVKGSSEILGGYNPIAWKSDNSYGATKDSFIFSFKNNYNFKNYILSRVIDEEKAIKNSSVYGPSFGDGDIITWGLDLVTGDCSNKRVSYEKLIREGRFYAEECEIFQIV